MSHIAPASASASTSLWLVALEFATADDAEAFDELATKIDALPLPDARDMARAFLQERLGIEGDDYVVAHFRSASDRARGAPDRTQPLTESLMEAFPDHARHSYFAGLADFVGGLNSGGAGSPSIVGLGEEVLRAPDAKSVFSGIGGFLWSRTGPGYLYNTFVARGNVVETVGEDLRPLDEAFGIFRAGGFTKDHAGPFPLSRLVEAFKAPGTFAELPYVTRLNAKLDEYWRRNRADWPVLARYQFVLRARLARDSGQLTQAQYELVMRGGAPGVPLLGAIGMDQLRATRPPSGVDVRRFDINGYTASNLVRFVASDGSEVMYVPGGTPSFVVARDERALRQWVLDQTKAPRKIESLLSHFSLYDAQDGTFWTGVRHGLENLGSGRWKADGDTVDHANAPIRGDVFEDMRSMTEQRMRSDAGMQVSNAWEAWRGTINRTATLLVPVGFIRPLVVPMQVGLGSVQTATGIEQAIDGRTPEERKAGLEQAGMTVFTNIAMSAFLGRQATVSNDVPVTPAERQPLFLPPARVNGRLGYPLGPTRAPGFPPASVKRIYLSTTGRLVSWDPAKLSFHTLKSMPRQATELPAGLFGRGQERFARLQSGEVARVLADGDGYRLLLRDRTAGPRLVRNRNNLWDLAFTDDNYVKGSVLAQLVDESYTANPYVFRLAAEIVEQLGSSEAELLQSRHADREPLMNAAVGQAIIDTLPSRLRDMHFNLWSEKEVELLTPSLAAMASRDLAFYGEDGEFRSAALADGTPCGEDQLPSDAVRLRRYHTSYVRREDYRPHQSNQWRTLFHVVAGEGRYARATWETDLRKQLADAIEARSTKAELEHIHDRWIEPSGLPERQRQSLIELSRLRHAVFDRHSALSAAQVERLRRADEALRGTLFPGETATWPAFAPLMQKAADPTTVLLREEADYLASLLARVAVEHDALLPDGLRHLLARGPMASPPAGSPHADQWTVGGRHYVRLRHLDGRNQVVETAGVDAGPREILAPDMGDQRGTGRHVVEHGGQWFPEDRLREGFALMPFLPELPLPGPMVESVPQPLRPAFGTPLLDLATNGELQVLVHDPRSGRSLPFPTRLDIGGGMVPYALPGYVFPMDQVSYRPDSHLILPVREDADIATGPAPDRTNYIGLLHAEQPASAFIEAGYADRHLKTLIETRRLRGMLREDTNIALVGATPEHTFTMVMPVTAETMNLVTRGAGTGMPMTDLPLGTVIVDALFGVRASVDDYPARVRAVADEWESRGVTMKRIGPDGAETRESPSVFAERLLASPVGPNLWNPVRDPISERRYVGYMRRRYVYSGPVRHAGLDWLETRKARRNYMSYFAPPHDHVPSLGEPRPAEPPAVTRMRELAEIAINASAMPAGPAGPFF